MARSAASSSTRCAATGTHQFAADGADISQLARSSTGRTGVVRRPGRSSGSGAPAGAAQLPVRARAAAQPADGAGRGRGARATAVSSAAHRSSRMCSSRTAVWRTWSRAGGRSAGHVILHRFAAQQFAERDLDAAVLAVAADGHGDLVAGLGGGQGLGKRGGVGDLAPSTALITSPGRSPARSAPPPLVAATAPTPPADHPAEDGRDLGAYRGAVRVRDVPGVDDLGGDVAGQVRRMAKPMPWAWPPPCGCPRPASGCRPPGPRR